MLIRNKLFILKIRNSAGKELVQYTLVGISGILINLFLLYFLTEFFNFYYILSAFLAGIAGGLYCFSIDKVWIFKEKLQTRFFREYTTYIMIGGISLILKLFLLYFLTSIIGIYYIFSQAIVIASLGIFTFVCNEIWTFRIKRKEG